MTLETSVLVVDDEERFSSNMVKLLQVNKIKAKAVNSGEAALKDVAENQYDVILLDVKMPGLTGTATLKRLREAGCSAKVIVLTGHASVDDAVELLNTGAYDYLLKPCKTEKLLKMIGMAHEQKMMEDKGVS
ncbi:MAG: response regulator [Desulfovibrionaceae bacterium]|nr:response regulator [Desulfovibrionaceae bacterium]MDD4951505.1 response regulator [Desulfovibrionaceae bacterium]